MHKLTKFCLLIFLTSCFAPPPQEKLSPNDPFDYLPEVFFSIEEKVFYSNGIDIYCGFKSWEHINSFKKKVKKKVLIHKHSAPPKMMVFIKHCKEDFIKANRLKKKR